MMKNKLYLVVIVVLFDFVRAGKIIITERSCTENEFYNKLKACELTCQTPVRPDPCTQETNQGCECIYGYVRNGAGTCVEPSDCNSTLTTNDTSKEKILSVNIILRNNNNVENTDGPENTLSDGHHDILKGFKSLQRNLIKKYVGTNTTRFKKYIDPYLKYEEFIQEAYEQKHLNFPNDIL